VFEKRRILVFFANNRVSSPDKLSNDKVVSDIYFGLAEEG
jgi:hypothetical protein